MSEVFMSEPGSPSSICPACGQELGHASNCSMFAQADAAPQDLATGPVEQELSPEFKDRIAPFDADIVVMDNRAFKDINLLNHGVLDLNDPSSLVAGFTKSVRAMSANPREVALRAHLLSKEETDLTEKIIAEGKNPFPNAKFVFLHTGDRMGFWKQAVTKLRDRAGWPFILLGLTGGQPDSRARVVREWGRDRGVIGNLNRDQVFRLLPVLMQELQENPLPKGHTDDDLFDRFLRVDKQANPRAWDPMPQYMANAEREEQPASRVAAEATRVIPYTKEEYNAWQAAEPQRARDAQARAEAEQYERQKKRAAEREAELAAIPEFQDLSPEMQAYLRELEQRVSAIEAEYPKVDPNTGRSRGNWLELEMLRLVAAQLQNPDSAIRQEIAKNAELAAIFNSHNAVNALLKAHYWGYLRYGAPELSEEQQPYQDEFKQTESSALLPARWREIANAHPDFREKCDRVLSEKLQEAWDQLAVSCLKNSGQAYTDYVSYLQMWSQEGALDAATVDAIQRAIQNEDPDSLATISIELDGGREVTVLQSIVDTVASKIENHLSNLNSILAQFGMHCQQVLVEDHTLRFSPQRFMRAPREQRRFRPGFNENHLAFPFMVKSPDESE